MRARRYRHRGHLRVAAVEADDRLPAPDGCGEWEREFEYLGDQGQASDGRRRVLGSKTLASGESRSGSESTAALVRASASRS
jgi:hypothetical protein